jgi:hypothetical protein
MQKVKIDIYISDLLYSYDCVIVPNFGGFVTNNASAKVQAIQHKFAPPSKQISFNKNLKNNDGLLSNHIASTDSISYEAANQLIQAFVHQTIEGFQKGDRIQIEKVGTLFLDPEKNVQFQPVENNDYLLDSFGLNTFRALPIARAGANERIEKRIKEQLPLLKEEEKKKRKYYWPAAAILVFFLCSAFLLNQQFSWVKTQEVNYSSLDFFTADTPSYNAKAISSEGVEKVDFILERKVNFPEGLVPFETMAGKSTLLVVDNRKEETDTKLDNTAVDVKTLKNKMKFHVMGGCFAELSNAEGLVKSLRSQGFEARLLGKYKNLYAVSFGSFARKEDARTLLSTVKTQENSSAWLLVKPF